ncbi:hypothetical protein JCM15765_15180 [Paradesulfitobacterium aromaticivorans]
MKEYIEKIYKLLHSPLVTPYNLLENAKLPNYEYVNFYKGNQGLVSEMKCTLDDGNKAIFYYHFDHDENLQCVYMSQGKQKHCIFDRQSETQKMVSNYQKNSASEKIIAI